MGAFYDFFFILGVLLCVAYIIVLYKNNKVLMLANKILIALFAFFVIVFLNMYAGNNSVYWLYSFTVELTLIVKIIVPTLLFFYIKSLFFEEEVLLKKHKYLLALPVVVLILLVIPILLLDILAKPFFVLENYEYSMKANSIASFLKRKLLFVFDISSVFSVIYLVVTLRFFLKVKAKMKSVYSYIEANNYIWIRYLLIMMLIVSSIEFIFQLIKFCSNILDGYAIGSFVTFLLVLSIMILGYLGLNQTKVLIPYFLLENNDLEEAPKILDEDIIPITFHS